MSGYRYAKSFQGKYRHIIETQLSEYKILKKFNVNLDPIFEDIAYLGLHNISQGFP